MSELSEQLYIDYYDEVRSLFYGLVYDDEMLRNYVYTNVLNINGDVYRLYNPEEAKEVFLYNVINCNSSTNDIDKAVKSQCNVSVDQLKIIEDFYDSLCNHFNVSVSFMPTHLSFTLDYGDITTSAQAMVSRIVRNDLNDFIDHHINLNTKNIVIYSVEYCEPMYALLLDQLSDNIDDIPLLKKNPYYIVRYATVSSELKVL